MTKVITDNSKVNINLLQDNEFLNKEIQKLNLVNIDLKEKLRIATVIKSGCRHCGGSNILSFDNDKHCKDCDTNL